MKLLFYLHHPAQFHLFKHTIDILKSKQHEVKILATKKDILEKLLKEKGYEYINVLPDGRGDSKFSIALGLLKQDIRLFKICISYKPDLLIGTSTEITHIGKLLNIPSLFFIEDDITVVPLVAKLAHPFATHIVTPAVCDVGKWTHKSLKYEGYQKLAYLHPDLFTPDIKVVEKYLNPAKPYFIIRLAKLKAHHDTGISGINKLLLDNIIEILKTKGQVFITTEKAVSNEYSEYIINIDSSDIHHLLYFSKMLIGDSQSMAVEAAMLGTPSIRISDFSGRISVLEELEHVYKLTFGIKPENEKEILSKVRELSDEQTEIEALFKKRREKLLADKINVTEFIVWLIENYPKSVEIFQLNPQYLTF
jgi:predicted glycosyltransferase